jgi:NADH:ubiquinone oxidoreductase subunit E
MIPIIPISESRQRKRQQTKGRQVDPSALEAVLKLLGDAPRQKDLLIEHLHKINDHFGYLPVAHLVALAHERRLAQTDVFEVASFYHHFNIAFESDTARTDLRLRVCYSW